jgi:hypothetical protein
MSEQAMEQYIYQNENLITLLGILIHFTKQ